MTHAAQHITKLVKIQFQKEYCINRGKFQTLCWYKHADYANISFPVLKPFT